MQISAPGSGAMKPRRSQAWQARMQEATGLADRAEPLLSVTPQSVAASREIT